MKFKQLEKQYSYIFIIFVIFFNCAPTAEKRFSNGIELYNNGKIPEAANEFESGLITLMSKHVFSELNAERSDNAFYIRNEQKIDIIYPHKLTVNISNDYNLVSFDPQSYQLALSNGNEVKIFNKEGKLKKNITLAKENETIKAVLILKNVLLYYINKKLYSCNILTSSTNLFIKDTFNRPYKDPYYSVLLSYTEKYLKLIIGIAGEYYLSIIDYSKKNIVLKNKKITTSKTYAAGENIYFITGKSGKWELKKYLMKKSIKKLHSFKDLADVEFTTSGLLFNDSDGFWYLDYKNKKPETLHFKYQLSGSFKGYPLMKYKENLHLIDMKIYIDKLRFLKDKVPAIFMK